MQKRTVERITRENQRWKSFIRHALGVADVCVYKDEQLPLVTKDDLNTVSSLLATAQTQLIGGVQLDNRREEETFRKKCWEVFADLNHKVWKSCFHSKTTEGETLRLQLEEAQAQCSALARELRLAVSKSTDKPLRDTGYRGQSAYIYRKSRRLSRELDEAEPSRPPHRGSDLRQSETERLESKQFTDYASMSVSPSHKTPSQRQLTRSPDNSRLKSEMTELRGQLLKEREKSLNFYRALKNKQKDCNAHHTLSAAHTDREQAENSLLADNQRLTDELLGLRTAHSQLQRDSEMQARHLQRLQAGGQDSEGVHRSQQEDLADKRQMNSSGGRNSRRSIGSAGEIESAFLKKQVSMLTDDLTELKGKLSRQEAYFMGVLDSEKKAAKLQIEEAEKSLSEQGRIQSKTLEDLSLKLYRLEHKAASWRAIRQDSEAMLRRSAESLMNASFQSNLRSSLQVEELTSKLMSSQTENSDLVSHLKQAQELITQCHTQLQAKSAEVEALHRANSELEGKQTSIVSSQDQLTRDLQELQRHLKAQLDTAHSTIRRLELEKYEADLQISRLTQQMEDQRFQQEAEVRILRAEKSCDQIEVESLRHQLSPRSVSSLKVSYLEEKVQDALKSLADREDSLKTVNREAKELRRLKDGLRQQVDCLKRELEEARTVSSVQLSSKETELRTLQVQVAGLQSELKCLYTERETLDRRAEELHVGDLRGQVERLTGLNSALQVQSAEWKAETMRLDRELEALREAAASNEARSHQQIETSQGHITALLSEVEVLRRERDKALGETAELTLSGERAASLERQLRDNLTAKGDELRTVQGHLNRANQLLAERQEELRDAQRDLSRVASSSAEKEEELKTAHADLSRLESDCDRLRAQVLTVLSQKERLEGSVHGALQQQQDLQAQVLGLEKDKASLEHKLNTQEQQLREQLKLLDDLEAECSALQLKGTQMGEVYARQYTEELDKLKLQQASLQRSYSSLDSQLSQTLEAKSTLEKTENQTALKLSKKSAEVLVLRRQFTQLEEQLTHMQCELEAQTNQSTAAQEQLERTQAVVARQETQIQEMIEELASSRQRVAELSTVKASCDNKIRLLIAAESMLKGRLSVTSESEQHAKQGVAEMQAELVRLKAAHSAALAKLSELTEASESYLEKTQALENQLEIVEHANTALVQENHELENKQRAFMENEKMLLHSIAQLRDHNSNLDTDNKQLAVQVKALLAEQQGRRREGYTRGFRTYED
jgi:CAP-Gly domain-containing linker protein 1